MKKTLTLKSMGGKMTLKYPKTIILSHVKETKPKETPKFSVKKYA